MTKDISANDEGNVHPVRQFFHENRVVDKARVRRAATEELGWHGEWWESMTGASDSKIASSFVIS